MLQRLKPRRGVGVAERLWPDLAWLPSGALTNAVQATAEVYQHFTGHGRREQKFALASACVAALVEVWLQDLT